MNNSAIIRINSERENIDTSPEYQRNSEVWTLEKKQLLIDSILNEFDIPKLYFHLLPLKKTSVGPNYTYAIIDGRQRLESIWAFIDNRFALDDDFKYIRDETIKPAGFTYADLSQKYPKLKIIFDSFSLPIVLVDTDDTDLIDDMFSRLNEAVPLNAAEKRNAMGGPLVRIIREVSGHPFFRNKVKFSNKRYQYLEISARLLYLEESLNTQGKYFDTKKWYLDDLVKNYKKNRSLNPNPLKAKVKEMLDKLNGIFIDKDDLLRSQAAIPIYYLVLRELFKEGNLHFATRDKLLSFKGSVENNRRLAEVDMAQADFELLEFDRMSQQGTNDAVSIRERVSILKQYLST